MLLLALTLARAGPGAVEPAVVCAADPDVRYARYLPTSWTADREWPLLVVLDPRGRGPEALERFVPAAEDLGWVVASAWESASDELGDDTTPHVVAAIVADVRRRDHTDPDGVVLTGLSGTARAAWSLAEAAPGVVFGVIGAGASTPIGVPPRSAPPFGWVGLAGVTDFNHGEVLATAEAVQDRGGAAVFDRFAGGHQWPGPDGAARALGFVTVYGEQHGRIEVVDGRAERVRAAVRADVEARGPTFAAWQLARGYPGLADLAERLGAERAVRRQARVERRLLAREAATRAAIEQVASWLLDPLRAPPRVDEARRIFEAAVLESLAEREPDTPRGQSAQRMLALARAWFGFYVPRDLQVRGDEVRRARSLEIRATL